MINLRRDNISSYSQRNNEIAPLEACPVTAMCQALAILGYTFPDGPYKQEEDNLAEFITKDKDCKVLYKNLDPNHEHKPYGIHRILCYGTDKWLNKHICRDKEVVSVTQIIENITKGNCVLLSGRFPTYRGTPINHIICCHGFNDDGLIISDSYGNYRNLYADKICGKNIVMPWKDVTEYIKPCNSPFKRCIVVEGKK